MFELICLIKFDSLCIVFLIVDRTSSHRHNICGRGQWHSSTSNKDVDVTLTEHERTVTGMRSFGQGLWQDIGLDKERCGRNKRNVW